METGYYSGLLNIVCFYVLIITQIMLIYHRKKIRNIGEVSFFLSCVMLYLIIDLIPLGTVRIILEAGPMILPFSFWILSRALFNDKPVPFGKTFLYGGITLIIYYFLGYLSPAYGILTNVSPILARAISLLFVMLAVYETQRGKSSDLIGSRIKLRIIFVYLIGITVIITLMVEIGLKSQDQEIPKLIQRIFILGFSTYFLIGNTQFKSAFFTYSKKKRFNVDPGLIDRIQTVMNHNLLYRQEKITIGQLAEKLDEQEYRVREAINVEMGYRNFTDFLNSFRIEEAKKLLIEQRKLTVLEIAYHVGFNSIGPFNRAFKENTGSTPTNFRKESN